MKILTIILICLTLIGCASVPVPILINHPKIEIGMTKNQFVKSTLERYGAPNNWSKQTIDGKTYETWYYYAFAETYDFVDNVLVGYSSRSRYYSKDGMEDIRTYESSDKK